jgi:CRP/FNR family transcriptional regulator
MVEDLSLRSVEARLARLLLVHVEGESVPRKSWETQEEIAARLGTVPDVVNRVLRKLSNEGMIQVERSQIRILDKEGLKNIAQVVE